MTAWLPTSGLIRLHHDYGMFCTDAPPIYHVASMLASLSTAVADSAVIVMNGAPHPLNLWIMLVGASTTDRKSTAARMAVERLDSVCSSRIQRIYGSPEGFIDGLVSDPTSLLYVSEGAAFFEQREAGYWKHARGLFMDLYDWTPVFKRKLAKGREIEIENPRLSILTACALPLLDHYATMTDWLGGFLPRFVMVMGEKLEHRPSLRADRTAEKQIEDQVYNCFNRNWGYLAMSPQAQKVLEDFSTEVYYDLPAYPEGIHSAICRLPESAIRMSGLYQIAEEAEEPQPGTLVITARSAQYAVALCRDSRDLALVNLAEQAYGRGVSREIVRIENIIRKAGLGGIGRNRLVKSSHMQADQLDKIIHTLQESDTIVLRRGANITGRPSQLYVHTEAKSDAVRTARNQIIDPEPQAWISVEGMEESILDGLPPLSDEPDDDDIDWN